MMSPRPRRRGRLTRPASGTTARIPSVRLTAGLLACGGQARAIPNSHASPAAGPRPAQRDSAWRDGMARPVASDAGAQFRLARAGPPSYDRGAGDDVGEAHGKTLTRVAERGSRPRSGMCNVRPVAVAGLSHPGDRTARPKRLGARLDAEPYRNRITRRRWVEVVGGTSPAGREAGPLPRMRRGCPATGVGLRRGWLEFASPGGAASGTAREYRFYPTGSR